MGHTKTTPNRCLHKPTVPVFAFSWEAACYKLLPLIISSQETLRRNFPSSSFGVNEVCLRQVQRLFLGSFPDQRRSRGPELFKYIRGTFWDEIGLLCQSSIRGRGPEGTLELVAVHQKESNWFRVKRCGFELRFGTDKSLIRNCEDQYMIQTRLEVTYRIPSRSYILVSTKASRH